MTQLTSVVYTRMRKRQLCDAERAAGCDKRRPPADLRWLFSQVAMAAANSAGGTGPRQLFHLLPGGSGGVSLLERQTYRQWRSLIDLQRVSQPRRLRQRTIIIQPLTSPSLPGYSFSAVDRRVLTHLQHFCSAFFPGMNIELGPAIDLSSVPRLTSRVHKDTQRTQVLVGDLIRLLESRRPRHAQCMMGVATVDLYPSPEWNFVMGHASLTSGCGVISFGRYFNSRFADSAPTLPQQLRHLWVLARVSCLSYPSLPLIFPSLSPSSSSFFPPLAMFSPSFHSLPPPPPHSPSPQLSLSLPS